MAPKRKTGDDKGRAAGRADIVRCGPDGRERAPLVVSAQHAARSTQRHLGAGWTPPSAQGSGSPAQWKRQLPWSVVAITIACCRGLGLALRARPQVRIWQRWTLEVGYLT